LLEIRSFIEISSLQSIYLYFRLARAAREIPL